MLGLQLLHVTYKHQFVSMAMGQKISISSTEHELIIKTGKNRLSFLLSYTEHIGESTEIAIAAIFDIVAHRHDGILRQGVCLGCLSASLQHFPIGLARKGLVQIRIVYWLEISIHHAAFVFI